MKLVPDAKNWAKWWSIRFSILGGAILTMVEAFPHAIGTVINALPPVVTSNIDSNILRVIGIGCVIASPIARVVKQSKLEKQSD